MFEIGIGVNDCVSDVSCQRASEKLYETSAVLLLGPALLVSLHSQLALALFTFIPPILEQKRDCLQYTKANTTSIMSVLH